MLAQTIPQKENRKEDVSWCIETVSGRLVNPRDPSPESIDTRDIAWALSRMPRFVGHTITQIPYNNAQHSVYVSMLVIDYLINPESPIRDIAPHEVFVAAGQIIMERGVGKVAVKALFHDGAEAYTGDIPSPVKKIPELYPVIKEIEAKLDDAIFKHLDVGAMSDADKKLIKFCDSVAQAIEGYQFMPSRGTNWILPSPGLVLIQQFPAPKDSFQSYKDFLEQYEYIKTL